MSSSQPEKSPNLALLVSGAVFGRYCIERQLGEGAMGAVFLARDTRLNDRPVALKVPKFTGDDRDTDLQRFHRESGIAATMSHPNLCPVYDVGEHNGIHYLAMGFIEGKPLNEAVGGKPLAEKQAAVLVRKIALAMQAAHDKGVTHRDLKPANIMMDARKEPIVMDFGLAKQAGGMNEARITQSGMILGTPAYMSPEQVNGDLKLLGPPADIYSLGVILYELLTGQRPYQGPIMSVLGQIVTKEPPPSPRKHRPNLDARLEAITLKAIAKSISGRYASMTEFAAALADFVKQINAGSSMVAAPADKPAAPTEELSLGSVEALVDAARQCFKAHDYAETLRLLDSLPAKLRTDEAVTLRDHAEQRQEEVADLQTEIDELKQRKKWKSLLPKVERLLKLKPAHAEAKKLQKALKTYGGNYTRILIDSRGDVVPSKNFTSLMPGFGAKYLTFIGTGVVAFTVALALIVTYLRSDKTSGDTNVVVEKGVDKKSIDGHLETGQPTGGEFALRFDTGATVTSEPVAHLNSVVRTYEAWGSITRTLTSRELNLVTGFLGEISVSHGRYRFYTYHGDLKVPADSIPVNQRFHLAGVNDGKQRRLYLNGRLIGQMDDAGSLDDDPKDPKSSPIVLGGPVESSIELDAVRISSSARYTANFEPPDRFTADQFTEVLYNFDEGQGDVLKDSSGHNRHGKIIGAKWVRRDGKPIGTNSATGWHGWPADAPKPAIAPFDAAQAKKHQEEWAAYLKVPPEWKNSIGMKFRLIPPGEFTMGSTAEELQLMLDAYVAWEKDANDTVKSYIQRVREIVKDEANQHRVAITKPYYLGSHEVTQGQYQRVIGDNPSHYRPDGPGAKEVEQLPTERLPVESLTWAIAANFCDRLVEFEAASPNSRIVPNGQPPTYRLPTEAEWELACRAGTTTRFFCGDEPEALVRYARIGGIPHPVGTLAANPFGLFDVHGNVAEWCQDAFIPGLYAERARQALTVDPASRVREESALYISRGGSNENTALYLRSAHRGAEGHGIAKWIGFRVALSVDGVRQALNTTVPNSPATREQRLQAYYDLNRKAAERALAVVSPDHMGVSLEIVDANEAPFIKPGEQLPEKPFVVKFWSCKFSSNVTNADLEVLDGLRHVISLNLTVAGRLDEAILPRVAGLRSSLKDWGLAHSLLRTSQLERLPEMPLLYSLALSSEQVDDQWKFLRKFPSLRVLSLYGEPFPDLNPLGDIEGLRMITLAGGTQPSDAQISALQQRNPRLRITHGEGEGLRTLGQDPARPAVRRLLEAGIPVKAYDLKGVLQTLTLDTLDQSGPVVQYWVESVPRGVMLTDELRDQLDSVTLGQFSAEGQPSADVLARAVRHRHELYILRLNDSDLTDAGLKELQSLTGLRFLDVTGTQVTPDGIAAYHRAVPGCTLTHSGGIIPADFLAEPEK